MKYAKPALTVDDQIALLVRRGMEVPDRGRAGHYLRHISYYRLRAYWLPFEVEAKVDGDHVFAPGTSFDDALELYVFDRRLRLLVIDAIERVEVSLRAAWAHHLALKYGSHGYLDPKLYDAERFERALKSLREEIDRSRDTFIVHYRMKYNEPELPPVWMVAELMSLGQLSKWFGNLKPRADRRAIAKPYGVDERVLSSFVHHLTHVRNICAHHGRLWNRQFTVTTKMPRAPVNLVQALNPEGKAQRRLYNTLVLIAWFMGIVAPDSEWKRHVMTLIDDCQRARTSDMGFPANWRDLAMWKFPEGQL